VKHPNWVVLETFANKGAILKKKESAAGMGILSSFFIHCYEHFEHFRLVSNCGWGVQY